MDGISEELRNIMKVSVLMITYNHERYIAQALESILSQKVDFVYEIVIGEDFSADNTREIVSSYQSKYPDVIRLLPSERNLGLEQNFARTLAHCRGDYVAILEGDDYWTSSQKMRLQVDFLNNHNNCSLCFHNVKLIYEENNREPDLNFTSGFQEFSNLETILERNYINTCSAMFRRCNIKSLPEWILGLQMIDWPLFILCAQKGSIGYIDQVMAVYRVHSQGTWSSKKSLDQKLAIIDMYKQVTTIVGLDYELSICKGLLKNFDGLACDLLKYGIEEGKTIKKATLESEEKLGNILSDLSFSRKKKAKIAAAYYSSLGFLDYQMGSLQLSRYCYYRAIRSNFALLYKRGIWSIIGKIVLDTIREMFGRGLAYNKSI